MTTDGTASPSPEYTPPRPASRRGSVVAVTATVSAFVGVGIGVLVGFLLFSGSDGESASSRAEQNFVTGCASIEAMEDEFPLDEESGPVLEDPLWWEIMGTAHFFAAAGIADSESELGEGASTELISALSVLDTEQVNEVVDDLLAHCAER